MITCYDGDILSLFEKYGETYYFLDCLSEIKNASINNTVIQIIKLVGLWKKNEVAGFIVFSQLLLIGLGYFR